MNAKPLVLCVDDEEFVQALMIEALGQDYDVHKASDGAEALQQLQSLQPDLIIMDVAMPAMDGYECCRRIKEQAKFSDTPVLFLSGKDAIEDRLLGFEAGGDDYLTKPFHFQLLLARMRNLLTLANERRELKETLSYASNTAMTAMISMSELGPVLEAMKRFNGCQEPEELASAVLACLASFGLEGAVQLRSPSDTLTLTSKGPASPLDLSIINHMAGMNRIEQFRSRLSVNYAHATLLVSNMPDDDERCGRLRDHLAMLAEAADVRVSSLAAVHESARRGDVIAGMLRELSETLSHIDQAQRDVKGSTTLAVHEVTNAIEHALLGVALSDAQEAYLSGVIHSGLDRIARIQNGDLMVQNTLSNLVTRLKNTV